MIKSIIMKDCATYPNEDVVIGNCGKINFFYGANGSGKSTIGNYLQNVKTEINILDRELLKINNENI